MMYQSFYSFSSMPFQLTPDSRFYFGSHEHRKAMAFLQYGLSQQEGFVVVTGEIGAGKTTLVEHLMSTLDPGEYVTARVVTTQLGGYDTLYMIASAFGISDEPMEKGLLISRVKQFFAGLQAQGKHPLVIVDEAQSLTLEAVEELRMLSNLNVGARAPFQGIFLGQPEFRTALSSPELQQLRQRVIASCHLGALNAEDTQRYIEHRLARVGWTGDPSFSDGAFEEIYRHSGGIPRRINSLCSRLLLLGYLEESHAIDGAAVANVAREMAVELGCPDSVLVWPPKKSGIRHDPLTGTDEIRSRLERVERKTDKHDRAIVRVLDLALKYLPAADVK
ncbi:MAG TPA: XrtA/PEP-CTERM system-associated ATPase [Rhizomicrobium sp.]|jgi:putative secretion ATPase (PEP-CTERM system associated)|nr:XrtA/PEP-CTERM system-associated ATPase [Rhizomicrobium sp.]